MFFNDCKILDKQSNSLSYIHHRIALLYRFLLFVNADRFLVWHF